MPPRSSQHRRGVERVAALCAAADGERSLRIALLDEIRRHVLFEFYAWLLTDPETTVGSAPWQRRPRSPIRPG
jgi:hypothetical protein